MALRISTNDIYQESRYPFETQDPATTERQIMDGLRAMESDIDSTQVDAEITQLDTGGMFRNRNEREVLYIKLRDTNTKDLRNFGIIIFPVQFGNLVYLVKYEYFNSGWFADPVERRQQVRNKLRNVDQWMEYTFIQTLGDFIYLKALKQFDSNFDANLRPYNQFMGINAESQ